MKYKIVSDSSSNLTSFSEVDFASVPLKITTDTREFVDNRELNMPDMISYFDTYKGRSGTACPGTGDWLDAFGDADCVFCVTITSTLSGSYNAAVVAKNQYEEEHPDRHVCVIDSLSAGPELALIIEKLGELIHTGRSFDEICKEIAAYQKKTYLLFALESLKNLANNGRVSPTVAKLCGLLGIRVVGRASVRGDLQPTDKSRGEKNMLLSLVKNMKSLGYTGGKLRIHHCYNQPAANKLAELIRAEFGDVNIRIAHTTGLCYFYAEKGGLMIGFEGAES